MPSFRHPLWQLSQQLQLRSQQFPERLQLQMSSPTGDLRFFLFRRQQTRLTTAVLSTGQP